MFVIFPSFITNISFIFVHLLLLCSKSDFVIYKLKQMGKITEMDIMQISKQFDSLDHGMYGKIALADLMETV